MRKRFLILPALILGGLLGQSALTRAAIPHDTPDTAFEREAFAFVRVLEERPGNIRGCFDIFVCAERAMTGLRLNPRLSLRFATNLSACFQENIEQPLSDATNVRIVAFHREGGENRFLVRAAQRDGGLTYLDFVVERASRGGCSIVDAFDYSSGQKLSEMARATIEARALEAQKNDHERLLGGRSEMSKFAGAIDQFRQLAQKKDFAGAIDAYAKLPPAAQKERTILRTQIRCAAPRDIQACAAGLALWRTTYPNDLASDLLALDYFKRKKLHDQYLESLERIDRQVGGDAYLDVVRARYCQLNCPGERPEKFARQAVQRDAKLRDAHQALVAVLAEKKDFEGVAQALSAQEKGLSANLGPVVRRAAKENSNPLAEFARSDAGVRWLAENEKLQARKREEAEAAATSSNGRFKLEAISYAGGRGLATINGRTVGLGDRLVEGYRVSRVGPSSVNIVSPDGTVETLTLKRGLAGTDETEPAVPQE